VQVVLDGAPGCWLPRGVSVLPQATGSLADRIGAAFDAVSGEPALLIGMDTPQVTPLLLARALRATRRGAAFGGAYDGGWWALGLAESDGSLVRGIETSTSHTGALQRERLRVAGLDVHDLPLLSDIDTPADASVVAALAPESRFAQCWRQFQTEAGAA
jgi:glycosyltransferase A (GT-A) superfamily protein (DUF2064 family)